MKLHGQWDEALGLVPDGVKRGATYYFCEPGDAVILFLESGEVSIRVEDRKLTNEEKAFRDEVRRRLTKIVGEELFSGVINVQGEGKFVKHCF